MRSRRRCLRLGQELVFFDHGGDAYFAVVSAVFDSYDASFALHANAFGQRDLRRRVEVNPIGEPCSTAEST